ncbi:MAG: hypothetical protein A3H93_07200 [Rhodocyclales bacterium RIFCSPLOWO2_02_FULL_63_24]|nr:MAG: hypothetical protein A3H93_07200 [Rhodocyclales bacterium RIFCSPLOWO2_02_FULL_63_24]
MRDIKNQKLLYHLTSVNNISGILASGLRPRAHLTDFEDVADQEIIAGRQALGLENFVPFHWFSGNPFDGRVQVDRRDELFVLITVRRQLAEQQNWQVIPFHPLATENIRLLNYREGVAAIDWETMNQREYHDPKCKSICMAECLAPAPVAPSDFFKIYVPSDDIAKDVRAAMKDLNVWVEVDVNEHMFVK